MSSSDRRPPARETEPLVEFGAGVGVKIEEQREEE